jgi:hypothetical protein
LGGVDGGTGVMCRILAGYVSEGKYRQLNLCKKVIDK